MPAPDDGDDRRRILDSILRAQGLQPGIGIPVEAMDAAQSQASQASQSPPQPQQSPVTVNVTAGSGTPDLIPGMEAVRRLARLAGQATPQTSPAPLQSPPPSSEQGHVGADGGDQATGPVPLSEELEGPPGYLPPVLPGNALPATAPSMTVPPAYQDTLLGRTVRGPSLGGPEPLYLGAPPVALGESPIPSRPPHIPQEWSPAELDAAAKARNGRPSHSRIGLEGPESQGRTASQISETRNRRYEPANGGAPEPSGAAGETINVAGLRPDPLQIDALTDRYANDMLKSALGSDLPNEDADGNPIPPDERDVEYRQSALLDGSFRDSVEALARSRATEEEAARQRQLLGRGFDAESAEVYRQRIAAGQRYVNLHRQYWDRAREAQDAADAAYPNPDDLLGGKGSWSRAVALGIAAVGSGAGLGAAAAVVNNQLALQTAAANARYNRLQTRANVALGNADEAEDTLRFEDAELAGRLAAGRTRLADQFDAIAANTADQTIQAKYQGLAAKLKQDAAKDLGAFATQRSNRDVKELSALERGFRYDAKRGIWTSVFTGPTGGGGGGGGNATENPFGKLGVRTPDVGGRPGQFWKANSEDAAKKATEAGVEYSRLNNALNNLQVLAHEARGAKSIGGQVWDRWKGENDAKYQAAFIEATQIAARVLHGRPPGKFTMTEVREEFPQLAKDWESNNVEPVLKFIQDNSDRNYNDVIHQYGYGGTYRPDRPAPAEPPNFNTLSAQIVGDVVPGHVPDVAQAVGDNAGGRLDRNGALGASIQSWYDNDLGSDAELASSLKRQSDSAAVKILKLRQDAKAGKPKAQESLGALTLIKGAIDDKIEEVRTGKVREQLKKRSAFAPVLPIINLLGRAVTGKK